MNVPSKHHVDSSGVLSNNFSLLSMKGVGSGHAGELAMGILITLRHLHKVTGTWLNWEFITSSLNTANSTLQWQLCRWGINENSFSLIQNDNANSHNANPTIKFLGNKWREYSFYVSVTFLKPDTYSTSDQILW